MTQRRRFRHTPRPLLILLAVGTMLGLPGALRADVLTPSVDEGTALLDKARPAIVRVESGSDGIVLAGTGFFVDDEGTVLTSSTIIGPNTAVRVEVNGLQVAAKILGSDPRSGLAMLRVNAPVAHCLTLGHSFDLKTGYTVLMAGYPLDLPLASGQGPISGFEIRYLNRFFATTHIHADVALSPGQVGAPLLNLRGEVVGLVVPSPDDGRSIYALPVEAIQKIMGDFAQYGRARHGWVGVTVVEVPDLDRDGRTVRVLEAVPGTPASRSGIRPGDTVMRIDSREIYRPADVLDASFFSQVGGNMTVVVRREDQLYNFTFAVAERPEKPEAAPVSRTTSAAPVRVEHVVALGR